MRLPVAGPARCVHRRGGPQHRLPQRGAGIGKTPAASGSGRATHGRATRLVAARTAAPSPVQAGLVGGEEGFLQNRANHPPSRDGAPPEPCMTVAQPPVPAWDVPEGFVPRRFGSGFIDANGPLYVKKLDGAVLLGFRVEPRHCNTMGVGHGGMVATFCDMLLPISAHRQRPPGRARLRPRARPGGADDRERAVSLFLRARRRKTAVRDGFRYDPYRIDLSPTACAPAPCWPTATAGACPRPRCWPRACRAAGHPGARGLCRRAQPPQHRAHAPDHEDRPLRLARLHRHLAGRRLGQGHAGLQPELCERFGLLPLDFDGRSDSIYHPFDKAGNRHMEYVHQRGAFDDVPLAPVGAGAGLRHAGARRRC
jgi:acyl-coenzyme A thioesterase PaaI-like protein